MQRQRITGLFEPVAQPIVRLTLMTVVATAAHPALGTPQPVIPGSEATHSALPETPTTRLSANPVIAAVPTNLAPTNSSVIHSSVAVPASTPSSNSATASVSPAALVAANPVQSSAYVQPEAPYTLGSGDRVRIDIFQVPQYSGEADVLIDGTLNLPLVGNLSVNGLTIEQTTAKISDAYSRYLRRPIVTVSLLTRRPLQIGVAGEVNRPGSYTINQEGAQYPTLTELLKTAGGLTRSADVRTIQVRRQQQSGLEQVLNVDLWQLIQTGDMRYDLTLRDGDSVFIPATNVDLAEAPILAAASFASEDDKPINIAVVGEVFRPGTYSVTGETARTPEAGTVGQSNSRSTLPTVTRAIQVAGGIKPMADIRRVQVRRLTRAGTEQTFEVNLWNLLQEGDLRQDAILQEGDTIVIPTATAMSPAEATALASASFSPDKIRVNIVGEVQTPGVVEVPPNTPMNQAILAAGGFNTRARRSSVDLVRLNPDGTVTKRRIEVDLAQGLSDSENPALRNNDVIIVRRSGLASVSDALGSILSPLNGVFSILQAPFRFIDIFNNN